jgi:hypothetical protein
MAANHDEFMRQVIAAILDVLSYAEMYDREGMYQVVLKQNQGHGR